MGRALVLGPAELERRTADIQLGANMQNNKQNNNGWNATNTTGFLRGLSSHDQKAIYGLLHPLTQGCTLNQDLSEAGFHLGRNIVARATSSNDLWASVCAKVWPSHMDIGGQM